MFNFVHRWARNYLKCHSSKNVTHVKPLHLFISGGAGLGKSHLLKTKYLSVLKCIAVVVNIDVSTINSELIISCKEEFYTLND